jgi:pimeloyl-ACP methyl ester carboxylesterase
VFAESGHMPHLEEAAAVAEAVGEFCLAQKARA